MMDPVELVVDALATFRLTKLAVDDAIFDRPRLELHDRLDAAGHPSLAYLTGCPWCAGLWFGAAVVISRRLCPRAWPMVARALACSAVTGILSER